MPITTFLGVQLMEASQAQPHLTHNEAIVDIDKAVAGRFAKDMTGLTNYTLTASESTNHQINLYGSPSASMTITLPATAKTWVFVNDTAQEAYIKTSAGGGIYLRPWSFVHLFCDGSAIHGAAAAIVEHLTVTNGKHFQFGYAAGSKIGSDPSEKFAFWGATPITQPASANQAAVVGTADATYSTNEVTLINALVTLVNQLRGDLVTAGIIKGSA